MKIGELARRAGVSVDTVRYYERNGILGKPQRTPSGYREYGRGDVRRLGFIRRAKALGFSLDEIRELLDLSGGTDMAAVRAAARDRLRDVEARIAELVRVRDALRGLVEACPGHGPADRCPILAALSGDDDDA